jgi:hypothetical protein
MYIDSTADNPDPMSDADLPVARLLRESLEDLMLQYKVSHRTRKRPKGRAPSQ